LELFLLFFFFCTTNSHTFEPSHFHSCHAENLDASLQKLTSTFEEDLLVSNGSCKIHNSLLQLVSGVSGENSNIKCVIDKFKEVVCSSPFFNSYSTESFCATFNTKSVDTKKDKSEKTSPLYVWLYSFGSVSLISVCSLLGIFILPLTNKSFYNKLLLFFLYLSVGTLTGNAVFHMLPKGFGNHGNIQSSVIVSIGIYSFYFLESLLEYLFRDGKDEDLVVEVEEEAVPCSNALMGGGESSEGSDSFEEYQECEMDCKKKCQKKQSFFKVKHIKPIAWMITIADAMHNLIDGMAIGASFVVSPMQGVTTSLAIFCEELPHELGDFAILLNAGMTFSQAAFFNFASACFCYIGMCIGILLSLDVHNFSWIFALTGGVFIYIALAGMMPEAKEHGKHPKLKTRPWFCFVVQNCGLLIGFVSMYLLAKYEDAFQL